MEKKKVALTVLAVLKTLTKKGNVYYCRTKNKNNHMNKNHS
jgi:uncharacterized protein (UPF0305 family)